MMRVCRLMVVLVLLVAINSPSLASFIPLMPDHSAECLEELGMKYNYNYGNEPSELAYNRTCWTKCSYEKEGKLDSNGNFVLSKFPDNTSDAAAECLNIIKATDICKKVSLFDTCFNRKTSPYWTKYEECEKYLSYNEESDETINHCNSRCQMIVDGNLDSDGKVNYSSLIMFEPNPNNTITREQAQDKCNKLVSDEDNCARDLNMYYCVSYMLYHWSLKQLENEVECAKEYNIYPFFGAQDFNKPRACYDRCIMIRNGDLNENDLKNSESFKNLNMTETQLEEAFNTCKLTMQETDKCTKDLYFYDCVTYLHYSDPVYAKKQKECALETNSPLVAYRQQYKENACNTRCLMVKDDQLDKNGEINKNSLRQYSINDTIIDESVNECNENNKNKTCAEDINAYYCASSKINEKVNTLCDIESKLNQQPDHIYQCYSRCLMVQMGQLSSEGEIIIDSFKLTGGNSTVIEQAIKTCKTKMIDEHECARVVNNYNCVSSEIWNIKMENNNSIIYAANNANAKVIG